MKIQVRVSCKAGVAFCHRQFTIAVDSKYEGKVMKVECPGCLNKLAVKVPVSPKQPVGKPAPEDLLEAIGEKWDDLSTTLGNIKVSDVFSHVFGDADDDVDDGDED